MCEQATAQKDEGDPHRQRREVALQLLQKAVCAAPHFGAPWLFAGVLHMELGNYPESSWCLEKAVSVEKTPMCITVGAEGYSGECLRRAGDLAEARRRCLSGIDAVERSDHMFRDTFRGVFLCSLGRTALEQDDIEAARAAYNQAVLHLRGRNLARGGGYLLVQALCGLSQIDKDEAMLDDALTLFRQKEGYNFDFMFRCTADTALLSLARAARSLGKSDQARRLFHDAVKLGCLESLE
jgi:tetratricopeptide (TPR) repeat protein